MTWPGRLTAREEPPFGLSPRILADLRRALSRFREIDRAVVFGSRARGTYRDASDIDLAVFAPTMSDRRFGELWSEIDELPIVFKIDLVHWDRLSSEPLRQAVLDEGIPLVLAAAQPADDAR